MLETVLKLEPQVISLWFKGRQYLNYRIVPFLTPNAHTVSTIPWWDVFPPYASPCRKM